MRRLPDDQQHKHHHHLQSSDETRGCWAGCHARYAAITAAVYSLSVSGLVVLLYSWRVSVNRARAADLADVYYGVQIAYCATIGTQLCMMLLSALLLAGVLKERSGLVAPWIMGCVAFMALEAVAMVYSNVLRDHVNRHFDALCKAEVAFYVCRAVLNVAALSGVMRFYHLLRAGITWKGPESFEL